jgi:DMSO/TMAO reductase YedYZ heme-binding membrane subunit
MAGLLVSLTVIPLAAWLLRKPLQKVPWAFYLLAASACLAGLYLTVSPSPNQIVRGFASVIQKGNGAFALFALVMFIGAFSECNAFRRALMPVRAELSIMAGILICGHFLPYIKNYLGLLPGLIFLKSSVILSLGIALVLLVLLLVLVVTSFNIIKRKMSAENWRRVQWLAYPFFGLIYFHQLGYLLVPVQKGSMDAAMSLALYTVVFVSYLALRIVRTLKAPRKPRATAIINQ